MIAYGVDSSFWYSYDYKPEEKFITAATRATRENKFFVWIFKALDCVNLQEKLIIKT